MFPEGIPTKSIIELSGEDSSVKTHFFLYLIARCILPATWQGHTLGGLGLSVVLVDTECQFNIIHLTELLDSQIRKAFCDHSEIEANAISCESKDNEMIIQKSLARLYVARCLSSSQFLMTLHSLDSIFSVHEDMPLLLVDSMSAFYWTDRSYSGDSISKFDASFRKFTAVLESLVNTYRLVAFISTISFFQPKKKSEYRGANSSRELNEYSDYLGRSWTRLPTHRIVFEECHFQGTVNTFETSTMFNVIVKTTSQSSISRKARFSIDEKGYCVTA